MTFANPELLLLALLIPVVLFFKKRRTNAKKTGLRFSYLSDLKNSRPPASVRFASLPTWLRVVALLLIIVALARPQTGHGYKEVTRQGIDIMLALDISTSMEIEDVKPNRLEAAKTAMQDFINHRTNDRIGLILFAGTSFTRCPLTIDYEVLKNFITPVKSGMVEDGTAIGMALANGVNRLKESKAKSKIIVLLTDGVNNRGLIDPRSAGDLAKSEEIKVYTIGLGRTGIFYKTVDDPLWGKRKEAVQSEIDEALLKEIAEKTGGSYFAAHDEKELAGIYEEIDRLEKTEIKSRIYYEYTEEFTPAVALALVLLLIAWGAEASILRRLP